MNSLNCNVIKDLLPLYVDGLASAESTQLVEEHLAGCEQCRQLTETLKADVQFSTRDANPEIDYLKKVRSKRKRFLVTTIILCVLVFGSLFAIGIKTYVIGSPVAIVEIGSPSEDDRLGIRTKFNSDTNELTIYGELLDKQLKVSRVKIELDKTLVGVYNVTVYGALNLFAGERQNGSFEEVIKIPDDNNSWSVYSMGSSVHDVMMVWSNMEELEQKYAKPLEKLTECLTANGKFSSQENTLDYIYFDTIMDEPCFVFFLTDYSNEGRESRNQIDCAVSENGENFYWYNLPEKKWEQLY